MVVAAAAAGDGKLYDADEHHGVAGTVTGWWYQNAGGAAGGRLVAAADWRQRQHDRNVTERGSAEQPYNRVEASEDGCDDDDGDVHQDQQQHSRDKEQTANHETLLPTAVD